MREYNIHEVLAILQRYYITDSPQMVSRWIRDGKIHGVRSENRKEGYRVSEEDLFEFIEEQRPGLPSIMNVYDEYVKNLNLDKGETQDNIEDHKEDEKKNEIFELRNRVQELEDQLNDMEQEKQIVEMNVITKMEENSKLIKENNDLKGEVELLTQLYEIIDEENRQFKQAAAKPKKGENKKERKKAAENDQTITMEGFKSIGNQSIKKFEQKFDEATFETHLSSIYKEIFNDGLIKPHLLDADNNITCPFTQKKYKQKKRFIDNAIEYYFDNMDEQIHDHEQLELNMANG